MFCKNCGAENRDDAKFCRSCGTRLETSTSMNGGQDEDKVRPKRSKRRVLLLTVAFMSLATVLVGIFLLLSGNDIIDIHGSSDTGLDGTHVSSKLYYSAPASEHIVEDAASAVVFVDNEVIVYLAEGCTKKDAESIAEQYGGEIVGLSAYTNSYQLRFDQTYTYNELNQLIEELEADAHIMAVSKNIAAEISCDERTSDPVWSGASKQYWEIGRAHV